MPCTRRAVLRSATAAAVTLAVPRRPRAQNPVRIGSAVLGAYTLSASVLVALEKGFFREQGVAAEFVPFRGGPDLVKAVIAGDVLLGLTGSTDILVFREAGSPIKMTATQADGNDFVLVGAARVGLEARALVLHLDAHGLGAHGDLQPDRVLRPHAGVLHAVFHRLGHEQAKVLGEHGVELRVEVVEREPRRGSRVRSSCKLEVALSRAQ